MGLDLGFLKRLLAKSERKEGWLAARFLPGEMCVAHVRRTSGGRPEVDLCLLESISASDPDALMKFAKELRIGQYQCLTLLNLSEYQVLPVETLNVPPEELKTAVRWKIKDLLDYHIDDAAIDVLRIPNDKGSVLHHGMYAIASRNEVIRRYVMLFEEANIVLSAIDIPEMAQRNIASLLEEPGQGLALLSFDDEGGLLTVTCDSDLYLSRHIEAPLSQLMQEDTEQRQRYLDRIVMELQRSFDYFERQFHDIELKKLLMAPLPLAIGLEGYLARNLQMTVEMVDLYRIFDFSKMSSGMQQDQLSRCFLTLGAALRFEEKTL
ncbi:MAG: agglutinin biogenesis protein MshI [Sulfuricellaceae bacterium]